ncbi:MAG: PPC domain-containing DNA-binding protein [Patescibacteria group bacterium]|jgi:hypothetical protein
MQYTKNNDTYIIRLMSGEELITTLTKFFQEQNIKGGWINGIGGSQEIELASFNLESKQYTNKLFNDQFYEVTSIQGNISVEKLHIHVTLANHQYQVFGGHCNKLVANPTIELVIRPFTELHRAMESEIGLALLKLQY